MSLTCTGFALGFAYLTCTGPRIQVPAARFCQTASVIRYSRTDTPETQRQVRANNAKVHAICGR